MKTSLLTLAISATLIAFAQAESTVTLSGVHLCCKSCVKGVDKAIASVTGVTSATDADAETVKITATNAAAAQKAVDALVAAGYFGQSDHAVVKAPDLSGATEGKVASLKLEGVHLCCGSCVKAVNAALGGVKGVNGHTAVKNAVSFEIKGDFSPKEVMAALHKAGLAGKVAN